VQEPPRGPNGRCSRRRCASATSSKEIRSATRGRMVSALRRLSSLILRPTVNRLVAGLNPARGKAQDYFERALAIARQQQAKSWSYPTFPPPLSESYLIQIPKAIRLKVNDAGRSELEMKMPAPAIDLSKTTFVKGGSNVTFSYHNRHTRPKNPSISGGPAQIRQLPNGERLQGS